jgi:hypothetical protein
MSTFFKDTSANALGGLITFGLVTGFGFMQAYPWQQYLPLACAAALVVAGVTGLAWPKQTLTTGWRVGWALPVMVGAFILIALAAQPVTSQGMVIAKSTFARDAEGWTFTGEARSLSHNNGDPPYIRAVDVGKDNWYWVAPAAFTGDRTDAYGGTLLFDIRETEATTVTVGNDIRLMGDNLTLKYNVPYKPGRSWTTYAIRLHTSAGWLRGDTNALATETDLRRVLGNLERVEISCDYSEKKDSPCDLTNVVLLAPVSR